MFFFFEPADNSMFGRPSNPSALFLSLTDFTEMYNSAKDGRYHFTQCRYKYTPCCELQYNWLKNPTEDFDLNVLVKVT